MVLSMAPLLDGNGGVGVGKTVFSGVNALALSAPDGQPNDCLAA